MSIGSSVKSSLIVFSSFPFIVKGAEPLVDSQIVKSNVCDNFLFKSAGVSGIINAVFKTKSFELSVSVKAVFYRLGNGVAKFLNEVD